jgi:hypothetical protein
MQKTRSHIVLNLVAFALLVILSGTAHAVQHDMQPGNEAHVEHSCVQADVSGDEATPLAIHPRAFLTSAAPLPRTTAPHHAALYTQPARGPPAIL